MFKNDNMMEQAMSGPISGPYLMEKRNRWGL